jgi:hypothetical protein
MAARRVKTRRSRVGVRFKQAISLRVASHALDYFKELAREIEVPHRTLINMALLDYAKHGRRPSSDRQPDEVLVSQRKEVPKSRSRTLLAGKASKKRRQ